MMNAKWPRASVQRWSAKQVYLNRAAEADANFIGHYLHCASACSGLTFLSQSNNFRRPVRAERKSHGQIVIAAIAIFRTIASA